jgi:hypothetical protein
MSVNSVARAIMGKDATNNIHRESKFVVLVTVQLDNGLSCIYSKNVTHKSLT